jgi:hypothetical protein
MQRRVDALAGQFFSVVAAARGLSAARVAGLQARVLGATDALKAKLADDVASWSEFMGRVAPHDDDAATAAARTGERTMDPITKALAALTAAKTDAERAAAMLALDAAYAAKYRKAWKKTTQEEEDGESEDAEDDDSGEDAEDDDSGEDAEEDEDARAEDDEDDEDDADDGKKPARRSRGSRKSKASLQDLISAVASLTGKSDPGEQLGALAAMRDRVAGAERNEKRLAKLESDARRERVNAMLKGARREGRITVKQIDHLRVQGMKDPKWLRGYLASMPKLVRTDDDATVPAQNGQPGAAGLSLDQMKMAMMSARADGVPVEQRVKEISDRLAASSVNTSRY